MKKFLKIFFEIILILIILCFCLYISAIKIKDMNSNELKKQLTKTNEKIIENTIVDGKQEENTMVILNANNVTKTKHKLNDWRLVLVNSENSLPENFFVELSNIDSQRQFDTRAIGELIQMLKDAKKSRVGDLWVQSAYRSTERQEELFNNKVAEYISYGFSKEEAEERTLEYINKANTSEHNIGLAVDFNYINKEFEKSKAFLWLQENAENYGFVLRYKKEKEEITKVSYEPWHWRYVGVEHAKKMNELDMCLEEYVDFLETN